MRLPDHFIIDVLGSQQPVQVPSIDFSLLAFSVTFREARIRLGLYENFTSEFSSM